MDIEELKKLKDEVVEDRQWLKDQRNNGLSEDTSFYLERAIKSASRLVDSVRVLIVSAEQKNDR